MNRSERLALIVLAAAIVASSLVHLAAPVGPFDDAFITFRYVENIVAGRGAVYNTGERVFGVSCPLYAGWLTLLKLAIPSIPLPVLAVRGNMLLLGVAAILVFLYLRCLGLPALACSLAAAAVALSAGILRASLGAMESPMFLALLFGALLACLRGYGTTAVTLASLSALTRPEGLLVVAVVLVASLGRPVVSARTLTTLMGLAPLVFWILGATLYYGTPVPHSVLAKARPLYPLAPGAAFFFLLEETGRWVITGVVMIVVAIGRSLGVIARAGNPFTPFIFKIAGAGLMTWLVYRWSRRGSGRLTAAAMALPIYLAAITVFYAVTNPLLLTWYLPLVQAPLLVAVVAQWTPSERRGRAPSLALLIIPTLMLTTAAASSFHQVLMAPSMLRHGANRPRELLQLDTYARTAAWIGKNSLPTESVAAPEIGVLGYLLDRRILDACGLVTPEALPFLPVPPGQRGGRLGPISVEFITATRPDLVATLPAFAERSLLVSPWFEDAYELVHEEPFIESEPLYRAVLVFRRRASPLLGQASALDLTGS